MLHELAVDGDLPEIPIYLDSPMGIEATAVYTRSREEHDAEMRHFFADQVNPIFPSNLTVTPTSAESRKLKPDIPLVGMDGIPLRDELELEIML